MATIECLVCNHQRDSWFRHHGTECVSERYHTGDPDDVAWAIDKLHRRWKGSGNRDVLFVNLTDDTGYRLMYDYVDYDIDGRGFACNGRHALMLRHYTHRTTDSSDWEREVTPSEARRAVLADID